MARLTANLILATFAFVTVIPTLSAGIIGEETLTCTHYAQANTESATCGDRPTVVCSRKCTGGVVVDGCSLAQQSSASSTRQTCTIGFSQTLATNSICVNAQGSFSCSGVPTGQATCSGCVDSQQSVLQSGPVLGALGSSAAAVVPAVAASPSAPIVSQNHTANASPSKTSALPVAQVGAVTPIAAQIIQPAVVASSPTYSQPGTPNSTTIVYSAIPASQDEAPLEDDNTTSSASSVYLKNSAQLVVTIGIMAVGAVTL